MMGPKKKPKPAKADEPAAVRAIRIKPTDYALIERAAEIDRRPVSQFIVVAAIERAERIITEHGADAKG